jgi:DNA-binding transcriptional regulator YiaG
MGSSMTDLSRGACAGLADSSYATSDPFYPEGGQKSGPNYTEAAKICARCPIRDLCLQDALTDTVQWGYRGGMDPEARQALKSGEVTKQRGAPTDQDLERRMALYSQGLADPAIAVQLGVTDKTITAWRRRNNLPANYPSHAAHTPEQQLIKQQTYDNGGTDAQIAAAAGVKVNSVKKWRARFNLPVNPARERISA